MDVRLKKWGNSLGLPIPHQLVESFGWDENSTVEMVEVDGALLIRQKAAALTLDDLLVSIPAGFRYPDDVQGFVDSGLAGQELL
jgi:antitoxin MazE